MKKSIVIFVLISILALSVGAAAKPIGAKKVSLSGFQYIKNTLVLTFKVSGFTRISEVQGSLIVDKQFNQLKCKFTDTNNVRCVAQRMNRYSGKNARIWLSGFVFYTTVPFLPEMK